MKIAIPVWQDRISPVFDSSRRLLVVDVIDRKISLRNEVDIGGESQERVRRLSELSADLLICGAISEPLAEQVVAAGIRLIPFIAGEVEDILRAYIESRLPSPEFLMPGCCGLPRSEQKKERCGCREWKEGKGK